MGNGAIGVDRLTNGEAENSLNKQADQTPSEGFVARCQTVLSDGGSNGVVSDPEEVLEPKPAKRAREQKELTFQDMYLNQGMFDEEDDDDSDWEPFQMPKIVEVAKWFCKNCTMVNLDDVIHCDICGEHKDSKILSYGFFASPLAEDEDLTELQLKINGLRDVGSEDSATNSSTAIGFDERMLLHAEVLALGTRQRANE